MRAHELTQVTEVAMNPSSFADSLAQAEGKGVLVGFEFEVLVPQEQLRETSFQLTDDIFANILQQLYRGNIDGFIRAFRTKPAARMTLEEAIDQFTRPYINAAKEAYEKLSEKTRLSIKNEAMKTAKKYKKECESFPLPYWFGKGMCESYAVKMRFTERASPAEKAIMDDLLVKYHHAREASIVEIATGKKTPGDILSMLEANNSDIEQFLSDNGLEWVVNDYFDIGKGRLSSVSKLLTPAIEQMTGRKVTTFNEYHEKKKNATDWYIEPDGSLSPNEGDGAAEIVTPPLPVGEAVNALKSFYQLAKQFNLYTNNSTGLHMNVSIPEKLDVAKLAVFLGDEYVLKLFGRENNDYAVGVLRNLEYLASRRSDELITTKTKKIPKAKGGGETSFSKLDMKLFTQIAKSLSNEHVASISFNGKYVSFRHAGGDYLNNQKAITDLLGRFVRAMIIASDPNAYRQEYIKKLTNLVGMNQSPATDEKNELFKIVSDLRTNGLPTLKLTFALSDQDPAHSAKVISGEMQMQDHGLVYSGVTAENVADPLLKAAVVRREGVDDASEFRYFSVLQIPTNTMAYHRLMSVDKKRPNYDYVAGERVYYIMDLGPRIPPSDHRTISVIKDLYAEYKETQRKQRARSVDYSGRLF